MTGQRRAARAMHNPCTTHAQSMRIEAAVSARVTGVVGGAAPVPAGLPRRYLDQTEAGGTQ